MYPKEFKPGTQKMYVHAGSQEIDSQWPRGGNNLNAHQQMNGYTQQTNVHTLGCHSAITKEQSSDTPTMLGDVENMRLSESSQAQKTTRCMLSLS